MPDTLNHPDDIQNESNFEMHLNAKNGIIYNLLKSSCKDGSFSVPLATKVHNLIIAHDVAQVLKITSKNNTASLLGLNEATTDIISYNEWLEIKEVLKEKLVDLHRDIQKLVGSDIKNKSSDDEVLELRSSLKSTMEEYYGNLLKKSQLLQEMAILRTEVIPKVCEDKTMLGALKKTVNEHKMDILESRTHSKVFAENSIALDAYKEIIEDIVKQQEDCKRDIEDAKQMLGRYKAVHCKEYEHIFKQYVEYKTSYDRISELYNKVKN